MWKVGLTACASSDVHAGHVLQSFGRAQLPFGYSQSPSLPSTRNKIIASYKAALISHTIFPRFAL